ncbi:hypothetical protein N5C43_08515 [Comamonas terrigena]|uniref:hypothetical protein n=1 Tax=Comamonas terrigena TaxID=32013 RepID=UPI00244D58D9|nr:hypothetical protein [Comamonas terrigena]MDH1291301.1 hypothetical protein [Comamonas terrigena]
MQKYKSNITSTTGAAIRNVPVTVLNEAGELASLFLDRAGAIAAPNPLVTDSSGNFYFYAVNGRYSLRTTVEGVTITDDDVVLLQDPEEITVAGPIAEAVAAAQAAARQAQDVVDSSGIPDMVAAAQNAVIDSNQALQEARGASLASAEAKLAAESAKSAAELAKGDAQAASSTANAAAQQANAAAQSAAQSAVSIDPARLLTPAERLKLDGVEAGATKNESVRINATSLQDFFAQCLARGSGFYRADGNNIPIEMRYCPGWFSKTQDTWSFSSNKYDTGKPVFFSGRFEDIQTSTWKQFVLTATAQNWTAQQSFYGGLNASRIGIGSTLWNAGVGVYCTDAAFPGNATITGISFDIASDTATFSATRVHRAAYMRVKGNKSTLNLAGNGYTLTGAECVGSSASSVDGEGEFTNLYGIRGYATDNSSRSGTASLSTGGWFLSEHQGTGTIGKTTTQSVGINGGVTNNNPSSVIAAAMGIYSQVANTQGTITNGYLYRGTFSGSGAYGAKWGLYLVGSTQNQIDGWLALTDTTDSTSITTGALRIAGGLGVAKVVYASAVSTPAVYTQSVNGGQLAGIRNKVINSGFRIQQRPYTSGAATTAGQYIIDRWRVTGTAGVTITNSGGVVTLTIPAGQTLQQVIEGANLQSGTYVLSWQGTAQGRIGAGAYGASGTVSAAIVGGTNTTIQFNTGTVTAIQFEIGAAGQNTKYEHLIIGLELLLCQRYYQNYSGVFALVANGNAANVNSKVLNVTMRAIPTIRQSTPSGTGAQWGAVTSTVIAQNGVHSVDAGTPILELDAEL